MNDMAKGMWAKVTSSALGQSVELPEGFRFDGDEVRITREGDRIVLEPAEDMAIEWSDEELHRLAQAGLDSGSDAPWDGEAIKRAGRQRLLTRRNGH
ncbi:hypothetical protein M9979_09070 [Sphingomonas sp. RP10(2022)]|uniref:SpoVT-AbrB domain-containing protein n=1 Tax=Sphingomonas liriopis TaxID=2949094 RepID=A0A9X2HWT9_9SPHN|nr:hypothetical protein [Sphingomonas liriopis]MCP3735018.1 hypothetical protein [Sphingomonas liriopis]